MYQHAALCGTIQEVERGAPFSFLRGVWPLEELNTPPELKVKADEQRRTTAGTLFLLQHHCRVIPSIDQVTEQQHVTGPPDKSHEHPQKKKNPEKTRTKQEEKRDTLHKKAQENKKAKHVRVHTVGVDSRGNICIHIIAPRRGNNGCHPTRSSLLP